MIWRVRKPGAKYRAKHQWHNWFAWYPVRVPTRGRMSRQHKIWLKTVRRRGTLEWDGGLDTYWNWRYALPGDEYWPKPKPVEPPPSFIHGILPDSSSAAHYGLLLVGCGMKRV